MDENPTTFCARRGRALAWGVGAGVLALASLGLIGSRDLLAGHLSGRGALLNVLPVGVRVGFFVVFGLAMAFYAVWSFYLVVNPLLVTIDDGGIQALSFFVRSRGRWSELEGRQQIPGRRATTLFSFRSPGGKLRRVMVSSMYGVKADDVVLEADRRLRQLRSSGGQAIRPAELRNRIVR